MFMVCFLYFYYQFQYFQSIVTSQNSLDSLIKRNYQSPDKEFRQEASCDSCYPVQESKKQVTDSLAHSLRGQLVHKERGEGGADGQFRPGGSQVVCPPTWWCCVQGSFTVPCFLLSVPQSGSWILAFLYLVSIICPNWDQVQLEFLCILLFQEMTYMCKHDLKGSQAPGPNLSQYNCV